MTERREIPMVDGPNLSDEAHRRASVYAPLPSQSSGMAAMIGGALTAGAVFLFGLFAGIKPEGFGLALLATIGSGSAATFLWFWSKERKHYQAWSKEYDALRREQLRLKPGQMGEMGDDGENVAESGG